MTASNLMAALLLVAIAAVLGLALADAASGANTLADLVWGVR